MNIAIYNAFFLPVTLVYVKTVVSYLEEHGHQIIIIDRLKKHFGENQDHYHYFSDNKVLKEDIDFLFSIGGDGTLLRSVTVVRDSKIPILGINTGRLGFLTSLHRDALEEGLTLFFEKKYTFIERSLLQVTTNDSVIALEEIGFALNEVSVNRKNTTSMLSIDAELDGKHLTTYWADGLIIATPTGSTGYSLSCGGPILTPNVSSLVITPIAPHNLNARPLVIPDDTVIRLKVTGREEQYLVSLDSRIASVKNESVLTIKKTPFKIKMVEIQEETFLKTLRNKLLWGEDKRN